MSGMRVHEQVQVRRIGLRRIWFLPPLEAETILQGLKQPGEVLKSSKKADVWRVGRCAIKESREPWPVGLIKHTFQSRRQRRAWLAAHYLQRQGVGVPAPWAYIEHGVLGLVWRHTMISEYLDGFRNVEQFLGALIQQGAGQDTLRPFLDALADAINALAACKVHHADLSGKNIFTSDGAHFRFIDLDAAELDAEYTEEKRLRNHVQLYDSFCDQLTDHMLVPFIERMLPEDIDPRVWLPKVRKGQKTRRLRTEKKWAKQGRLVS